MAGNILTAHFEGLPIVDLAGPQAWPRAITPTPSSASSGPTAFAGRPCKLMFKDERPARFGSKTVTSTRSVAVAVKALIAVEPPAQLSQSFFEDDRAAQSGAEGAGR